MVKKPGPKEHRPVLTIGDNEAVGGLLFQKCYDPLAVLVVIYDLPIVWRRGAADNQSARPRLEVGFHGRDPEIDADGSIVGVNVNGRLRLQSFEGPSLTQVMCAENVGKRTAQLVRDLQE